MLRNASIIPQTITKEDQMHIAFYGLLHLCEGDAHADTASAEAFRDRIAVYLKCAITLSNSLRSKGLSFTLLTNKKSALDDLVRACGGELQVKNIPFTTAVPHGINFYSAHFKRDALRWLSTLNDDYVALCDLDMVCINDVPRCLVNNVAHGLPMCYDISDQRIQEYGHERIIRDLKTIHGLDGEGRWSGGEFISGPPAFFLTLTKTIDGVYDNYIDDLERQHHVGDESTTSAALEMMRLKGTYVADAGPLGIVGRFWSGWRQHHRRPFKYMQLCFLLHLPADKQFLASFAGRTPFEASAFFREYGRYRRSLRRLLRRSMKYMRRALLPLVGRLRP